MVFSPHHPKAKSKPRKAYDIYAYMEVSFTLYIVLLSQAYIEIIFIS